MRKITLKQKLGVFVIVLASCCINPSHVYAQPNSGRKADSEGAAVPIGGIEILLITGIILGCVKTISSIKNKGNREAVKE